jgi:adenosylcobinamide-GDP ribazoletransferase
MTFEPLEITRDTARALGFLTRFSIPAHYFDGGAQPVSQASGAFPLAGLIAALPAAAFLLIAPWLTVPPLLAAVIAVGISIIVCGALHEDGLADTADGFFGAGDAGARLDIMKDSRNGTYGTLALALSVAVKIAALGAIAAESGLAAAFAATAASVAARAALVWHWFELPNARPGGTAEQAGKPDKAQLNFALMTGIPLAFLPALFASGLDGIVLMASLLALSAIFFVRLCRDKISGHTGDTLGAAAQIAEMSALIALASTL